MRQIAILLIAIFASSARAGAAVSCAEVWKRAGSLQESETLVWRTPQTPGDGVASYVKAAGQDTDTPPLERLDAAIDGELNKLFVERGMTADSGVSRLRVIIQDSVDVHPWDADNAGPLEKQVLARGIYTPHGITRFCKSRT